MSDITIDRITAPFRATVTPPGSKSLTNRALILAALAKGQSTIRNILFADDTRAMLDCLKKLGFQLTIDESSRTVHVEGHGGSIPAKEAELFCGNSGTTIRFTSALCALGRGRYTLDGVARMRQRPIGPLVDLLRNLGARIQYKMEEGYPPIEIQSDGLPGGMLSYGSAVSSQYLSAVLMASPYTKHEVRVDLLDKQTSWPYVAMTMQLMDRFGHTPELQRDPLTGEPKMIVVPEGSYESTDYSVEPDASNASYFLAAAAIHPGASVTVEGLGKNSLQGDVGFADVLHRMGADLIFGKDFITIKGPQQLEGIEIDLLGMPDMVQTLAVVALLAKGDTTIHGVHTLRVKETDRLAALQNELQKFGAEVKISDDSRTLTISPPDEPKRAEVATYDDHRMAMSFALAGTKIHGVVVKDAECVNKTYPEFFEDLKRLR